MHPWLKGGGFGVLCNALDTDRMKSLKRLVALSLSGLASTLFLTDLYHVAFQNDVLSQRKSDRPPSTSESFTLPIGVAAKPVALPYTTSDIATRHETCAAAKAYAESLHVSTARRGGGGLEYLFQQGIVLALATNPNETVLLTALKAPTVVQIPIYNCGNCTDPQDCRVSFHAHLRGEHALVSAKVVPSTDNDYLVEFIAPPGEYHLELYVRWFRGLDMTDSGSHFLGPPGRRNFAQGPLWRKQQAACVVFGSRNLDISIASTIPNQEKLAQQEPTQYSFKEPPVAHCRALDNPSGYWERVNQTALCVKNGTEHPGECFVLDRVNKDWLWRGHDCRYEFLSTTQVSDCLSDTSIYVLGDSLTAEFYHNLGYYVPHLIGERVFWQNMVPNFGNVTKMLEQTQTSKLYIVVNFKIAHLVWKHPMEHIYKTVIPEIKQEWQRLQNAVHNHSRLNQVQVVFATGVPAHFERERFITQERMLEASAALVRMANKLGISVLDTITPFSSRPDASWDGFHFLQVLDREGGASKMLLMMLLNHICMDQQPSTAST